MTRTIPALLASAVVAVLGGGCFTVHAELPGTLRGDVAAADVEKVGELKIEKGHWFFVAGLVGAPPRDVFAEEIKKQVQAKGGDGVGHLRFESESGCLDVGLTGCTFGIVAPRTYRVSGDIVRLKTAPLPGKPARVSGPVSASATPSPPSSTPTPSPPSSTSTVVAVQRF